MVCYTILINYLCLIIQASLNIKCVIKSSSRFEYRRNLGKFIRFFFYIREKCNNNIKEIQCSGNPKIDLQYNQNTNQDLFTLTYCNINQNSNS